MISASQVRRAPRSAAQRAAWLERPSPGNPALGDVCGGSLYREGELALDEMAEPRVKAVGR